MVDFYQQFELLDLVKDDGVKTFEATEIATGRPVRVHLFVSPKAPLQAALLKAVDRLPGEEAKRILHRGKNEGTPYLVTDRLLDHKSLQDWVLTVTRPQPVDANAPQANRVDQPMRQDASDTSSGLATAGAWKIPATLPVAGPPVGEPAVGKAAVGTANDDLLATVEIPVPTGVFPPAIPEAEPSEFTRMFQAPVPLPVETPPPASSTKQPASKPAGEFTRMFQSTSVAPVVPAPRSVPSAAPPRKAPEPGEFTRMFQSSSPSPAPLAPKPAATQGEFTRMFQRGPAPPQPAGATPNATVPVSPAPLSSIPQSSSPAGEPGEFTGFFQTPIGRTPSGPLPPAPARPLPSAPLQAEKAGEFTRMFGQTELAGLQTQTSPAGGTRSGNTSDASATQTFGGITPIPSLAATSSVTPPSSPTLASTTPSGITPEPPLADVPAVYSPVGSPPFGPGEYTRMFSAPAELTLGQASNPAAESAVLPAAAITPVAMGQPQIPQMQVPQMQSAIPQAPALPMIPIPQAQLPQVQVPQVQIPQVQVPQPVFKAPVAGAPPTASSNLSLILGLVGLIVVAIAVVIYFAMAKR